MHLEMKPKGNYWKGDKPFVCPNKSSSKLFLSIEMVNINFYLILYYEVIYCVFYVQYVSHFSI